MSEENYTQRILHKQTFFLSCFPRGYAGCVLVPACESSLGLPHLVQLLSPVQLFGLLTPI